MLDPFTLQVVNIPVGPLESRILTSQSLQRVSVRYGTRTTWTLSFALFTRVTLSSRRWICWWPLL